MYISEFYHLVKMCLFYMTIHARCLNLKLSIQKLVEAVYIVYTDCIVCTCMIQVRNDLIKTYIYSGLENWGNQTSQRDKIPCLPPQPEAIPTFKRPFVRE